MCHFTAYYRIAQQGVAPTRRSDDDLCTLRKTATPGCKLLWRGDQTPNRNAAARRFVTEHGDVGVRTREQGPFATAVPPKLGSSRTGPRQALQDQVAACLAAHLNGRNSRKPTAMTDALLVGYHLVTRALNLTALAIWQK